MREKKEFNFAQRWIAEQARENGLVRKTNSLVWVLGLIVLLGAVGSTPWLWEYKLQRDITQINQQIADLGELTTQVKQLKSLKAQAADQQKILDLMKKTAREPGPILEKLKKTLPVGTVVNTFSLQDDALKIGVSVPTPVDVARLWVSLRDSGMFQDVVIQPVSLKDQVQTLNFDLKLK